MLVSIIMPFYDKWELTHARLLQFHQRVPANDCEIILVDDCSRENYDRQVAWWQKQGARHTIRYRKNKTNLGFGGAHNAGAKISKGDILVFFSNDVEIFGDFVSPIVEILSGDRKVLVGGRQIYWPGGWNEFATSDGKPFVVPYLEGWLIACTRDNWKELGGWDLRYGKFDYEDIDLSMTALSLGYNLVALNSKFLRHISGVTVRSLQIDRQAITTENRKIFVKKWQDKFDEIFRALEDGNGNNSTNNN